jgi:hypothetical protein
MRMMIFDFIASLGIAATLRSFLTWLIGEIGPLAVYAGVMVVVGLVVWWCHRHPEIDPPPPGLSAITARKLHMTSTVDSVVVLLLGVIFLLCLAILPADWLFWYIFTIMAAAIRVAQLVIRHEQRLLAEDRCDSGPAATLPTCRDGARARRAVADDQLHVGYRKHL